MGTAADEVLAVPVFNGHPIYMDGCGGVNTANTNFGYSDWYSFSVNNGVVTAVEFHASGTVITLVNFKYIRFDSNSSLYAITPTGVVLVSATPTPAPTPAPPSPSASPGASPTPTPIPTGSVIYPPNILQPSAASDIVGMALQNNSSADIAARPLTFGQVFVSGQVPATANLVAIIKGVSQPVQMDVKTTNPDGSVRMSVLTLQQPAIPANSSINLMISSAGTTPGTALTLAAIPGYSFVVDLTFTDGTTFHSDVAQAVIAAASKASYWMKGPQAVKARIDIPIKSSMHLVVDVTKYADGSTATDAQFNNDISMSTVGGTLSYTANINFNGKVTSFNLTHYQYQNWHRVFYSAGKPEVNIQHDVAYLIKAGAVLPYNLAMGVSASVLQSYAQQMSAGDV